MNRRTILATAGAITLVIVTGAAAAAANLGLLDSAADPGNVGDLTPASASAEAQTVTVEPAPSADPAAATGQSAQQPSDDDGNRADDRDERRDHDRRDDESRQDDHDGRGEPEHYEGHDDDD